MASLGRTAHLGKAAGRRVQESPVYLAAVTGGLWAYGLRTLRAQPFGGELLTFVALGFACFGVFCFVWSRHARHDV
jgi:hypothetical protein